MPIRRKPKKSSRKPRSVDAKQNAAIKKLKTQVKKLSKGDEKKWYDIDKSSTAVPLAGTVQPLLALDLWDNTNTNRHFQREGNSINIQSYSIKGQVYIDQYFASPDTNNKVRIMLVQMTDDNIIQPALTDILEDPTGDRAVYSFLKIKGQRRFKVHYDKLFNLQNPGQYFANASGANAVSTATEPFRKEFRIKAKIPKAGLKASYAQGSISGNGPVVNGLFLIAYSDSGVVSHPAMFYRSRMRFLDN
jgi:hypothetical protein